MKIVIAGFGSAGRRHFRNLRSLGERDITLYRSNLSTLDLNEIQHVPTETDLDKILVDHPDAVIIANPTSKHIEVAKAALKQGCHVFIEKPLAHSHEEGLQLKPLISNQVVAVGFQYRFHPGLKLIKALIGEYRIGRILSAQALWGEYLPDWHPWEDHRLGYAACADLGGGVVRTLSHPLDYLCWLFGSVAEVFASLQRTRALDIEVEDFADITLGYQSGVQVQLHLDYLRKPTSHRLEIIGTNGMILLDNSDGNVYLHSHDRSQPQIFQAPDGFERNTMFLSEMVDFLQAINENRKPACTYEDGLLNLALIEKIFQSDKEKRTISCEGA